MVEHSADLLTLMIWAFGALGALMVAGAAWGLTKVLERLDTQDVTLQAIRDLLAGTENRLVYMIHHHDIRLTKLEGHCGLSGAIGGGVMRRHDDPGNRPFPDCPSHE